MPDRDTWEFINTFAPWLSARAWMRERAVPMRIGLLSERIVATSGAGKGSVIQITDVVTGLITFGAASIRGLLTQPLRLPEASDFVAATTVTNVGDAPSFMRLAPPDIRAIVAARGPGTSAVLLRSEVERPILGETLVASGVIPRTDAALAGVTVGGRRAARSERAILDAVAAMTVPPRRRRGGDPKGRTLVTGEVAVFDLPGAESSPRFASSGTVAVSGAARVVAIGLDGRVALNAYPAAAEIVLPAAARAFAVFAGSEAEGDVAGWVEASRVAYLGQSLARCRGGFIIAEGASRTRGGRAAGTGWMQAGVLTDQSSLVETRFDAGASAVALLLDGTVTERELGALALTFDGAEAAERAPLLVPADGKTLIVYGLRPDARGRALAVRLAGRTPGRLDGMIAARMPPERLVGRFINGALSLDLATAAGKTGSVRAVWSAPADLEAETVE